MSTKELVCDIKQCGRQGCGNTNLSRVGSVVSCACGWSTNPAIAQQLAEQAARERERVIGLEIIQGKGQQRNQSTEERDSFGIPIFRDAFTGLQVSRSGISEDLSDVTKPQCKKCGSRNLSRIGELLKCACGWTNTADREAAIHAQRAEAARRKAMLENPEINQVLEQQAAEIERLKAATRQTA